MTGIAICRAGAATSIRAQALELAILAMPATSANSVTDRAVRL